MKNPENVDVEKYFVSLQSRDGILLCQGNDVESKFSNTAQDNLFRIEDSSWWFQYRANVIGQLAQRFFSKEKMIFDVGGGNGYTTHQIQKRGYMAALLEPTFAACLNARERGLQTVICGTLTKEAVKDNSMEQIFLLDVLEHIEHDAEFLQLMWSKLEPGGKFLLTVPAFRALWSSEDDAAGHYRRYRLKQLESVARAAGFSVSYINYFFEFLFLPILVVRVWMEKIGLIRRSGERTEEEQKRISESQFKEKTGIVQKGLNALEHFELKRLLRGKKVRFGSSIICVLEKHTENHELKSA